MFGPRKVVSLGPQGVPVREVDVAAFKPPGQPPKLVAVWIVQNGTLNYSVSNDGGKNWSAERDVPLPGPAFDSPVDPTVTAAADGRFVATYMAGVLPGLDTTFCATVMAPGCDLFGDADCDGTVDDDAAVQIGEAFFGPDFPVVASDGGHFYMTGTEDRCYMLFSDSGDGRTWTTPRRIQTGQPPEDVLGVVATPTVDAGGTLYLAYIDIDETCPPPTNGARHYRLLTSVDAGATFDLVPALYEQIHPSFDFYFNDHVPGAFRIPSIGWLFAHPNRAGWLYLVFTDCNNCPTPITLDADLDIWLKRSRDGGQSWTARQRVNQDGPWGEHPEYYDQWMPRIAVDEQDRVHIVWYDTRLSHPDPANPPLFDIEFYYAWALDTNPDGSADLAFTETSLGVAIRTDYLINQGFIGDYHGVAWVPLATETLVVPVYMGTRLNYLPGGDGPGFEQFDETIFSHRIRHANP